MYSNYFLALVKETTGDMTLLVIPRTEGLTTRHMTMSGSTAAGTAFVDLDNVRVPIDMVVGERGKGFKYIVSNFNHEVRPILGFASTTLGEVDIASGCSLGFKLCDARGCASRTRSRECFFLSESHHAHKCSYALSRETFGKKLVEHRK